MATPSAHRRAAKHKYETHWTGDQSSGWTSIQSPPQISAGEQTLRAEPIFEIYENAPLIVHANGSIDDG
jgi:hypothetical protein